MVSNVDHVPTIFSENSSEMTVYCSGIFSAQIYNSFENLTFKLFEKMFRNSSTS